MDASNSQLMNEIHEAVVKRYGSFEDPDYSFFHDVLQDTGRYAWGNLSEVVGELSEKFTVVDDTDPNVDVCVALMISYENKIVCGIDLSLVGNFAAVYKKVGKGMKYLTLSQSRLLKLEKQVLSVLEKNGIKALSLETLRTRADFRKRNLEENEPYFIYNVLFSAYMPPGFE